MNTRVCGNELGFAGDLLWCESSAYVKARQAIELGEDPVDLCDFRAWVLLKAPKLKSHLVYCRSFSWFRQP